MSEQKIKYLEHPVSPEEKRKWRDKGYKIIDKQFEPEKTSRSVERQETHDDEM